MSRSNEISSSPQELRMRRVRRAMGREGADMVAGGLEIRLGKICIIR
jgi:hypothetical protein